MTATLHACGEPYGADSDICQEFEQVTSISIRRWMDTQGNTYRSMLALVGGRFKCDPFYYGPDLVVLNYLVGRKVGDDEINRATLKTENVRCRRFLHEQGEKT